MLTFVESAVFTGLITGLVDDDAYAAFQRELAENPEKGAVMAGCGGVRKVRMRRPGRGKAAGPVSAIFICNTTT